MGQMKGTEFGNKVKTCWWQLEIEVLTKGGEVAEHDGRRKPVVWLDVREERDVEAKDVD